MAVGSKDLAPAQLDGFDNERLVEELRKAKEELFNLRSSPPPDSWRTTVACAR